MLPWSIVNNNFSTVSDAAGAKNGEEAPFVVLVPCRAAMHGRMALHGTYFQINEVFLCHWPGGGKVLQKVSTENALLIVVSSDVAKLEVSQYSVLQSIQLYLVYNKWTVEN